MRHAIDTKNWEQIRWICANKANPDLIDGQGFTPLMFAAQSGRLEAVQWVVEREPDSINQQDSIGWTAIFYATQKLSIDTVDSLISRGAKLDLVSKYHKFNLRRVAMSQMAKLPPDGYKQKETAQELQKRFSSLAFYIRFNRINLSRNLLLVPCVSSA